MRVVMTLLARDEADVVAAQISYHLSARVDYVIATDHASVDATPDVLERFRRQGVLHLISEPAGELRQADWVTRMARLAAEEYGADWVLNTDADEFWWPRGPSIPDVLRAVPDRYGIVHGLIRQFPPRPDDGSPWPERMTVRLSSHAPVNDPSSPWRPVPKLLHRAHRGVTVSRGSHTLHGVDLLPLRGWYPLEVLHFPVRSIEQLANKAALQVSGFATVDRPATAYHQRAYDAVRSGTVRDHFDTLAITESALARGLESGVLTHDSRVRDALRALAGTACLSDRSMLELRPGSLTFDTPGPVDDALYAVDVANLLEADLVRARRQLDLLAARVSALERMPTVRARRGLAKAAHRLRRRPG
jgi:hypothetical protein